ncbi:hypothetical protein [Nonomuraea sp. NPDC049480]|uniref:hypothetical protein n=1 Tax=Nonomuraea sp. NPDC049480 TaxID=3364353 RepID=UPI00378C871B
MKSGTLRVVGAAASTAGNPRTSGGMWSDDAARLIEDLGGDGSAYVFGGSDGGIVLLDPNA